MPNLPPMRFDDDAAKQYVKDLEREGRAARLAKKVQKKNRSALSSRMADRLRAIISFFTSPFRQK